MESLLSHFLTTGIFAFLIVFTRVGAAITIMPGVGDSFVPANIRLYIALGLSLVLAPMIAPFLPANIPATMPLLIMIATEFIVGAFYGAVARALMVALDTGGMIISTMSGLGNAQLFNPAMATQGSLVGAFLSMTGVVMLFTTNMHHMLFYGILDSYEMFPVGQIPDTGGMADIMAQAIGSSFRVGLQIGAPFVVIGMVLYIGMGVMTRLMPQVQVFMLAVPLQILLAFVMLSLVISSIMLYFLAQFQDNMVGFFDLGGAIEP
jgi:flagellar biosynthetic protein FliR